MFAFILQLSISYSKKRIYDRSKNDDCAEEKDARGLFVFQFDPRFFLSPIISHLFSSPLNHTFSA